MLLSEFIKNFPRGDIVYGYSAIIDGLSLNKAGGMPFADERIKQFWQKRFITTDRNPNTRPWKAKLVNTVLNGNTVHFILNDIPNDTSGIKTVNYKPFLQIKEITISELKFIARYYECLFEGYIKFYYINSSIIKESPPIWNMINFSAWGYYYQKHASKERTIQRRVLMQEIIKEYKSSQN